MKVAEPPSGPPFFDEPQAEVEVGTWTGVLSTGHWLRPHGLLVFLSALIANLFVVLIGDNRAVAALLAALIFCALFTGWTYYPLGLPGQPGTHL